MAELKKSSFLIFADHENKENIDPTTGICSNTKPNLFSSKKRVPFRDITPSVTGKFPTSPKKSRQIVTSELVSNTPFNLSVSNIPTAPISKRQTINNGYNLINGVGNGKLNMVTGINGGSFSIYHDVPINQSVKSIR